jgi:hypothetical protein
VGLFSGVGGLRAQWDELMPALSGQRDDGQGAWAAGLSRLHPFWLLRHLSNSAHALLSVEVQAKGEGVAHSGPIAGAEALASASRALADGAIDAAIVLAHDSLLEPEALIELGARDPSALPGEAAAALVLARPADAGSRALAILTATTAADGEPGQPRPETLTRAAALALGGRHAFLIDEPGPGGFLSALGQLGAALPLVQAVLLGTVLRSEPLPRETGLRKSEMFALGLATGAPGLASAVLVQLPASEGA